jgi:putative sugar O-methyltransferase
MTIIFEKEAGMKLKMCLYGVLFFDFFCCINASLVSPGNFIKNWSEMQISYDNLCKAFAQNNNLLESIYLHPYWKTTKNEMAAIIRGQPDHNFLQRKPISGPMVRKGFGKTQEYEVAYLNSCLDENTQVLLKKFSDNSFGGISYDCKQFNCSVNSLGMLFYLAKILELNKGLPINTIVELGAGYGCFAHIAKQIIPDATYIIFDLPEYLVIQELFLKETLPQIEVITHTKSPTTWKGKAIHLVPIFLLSDLDIKTDIFVSTFALSESPIKVQEMVVRKNFFSASFSYITGQFNGWGSLHNFVDHLTIIKGIKNIYNNYYLQPFHNFDNQLFSYEMYGKKIN